jgi:uncharacterized protein (DUF2237 family)
MAENSKAQQNAKPLPNQRRSLSLRSCKCVLHDQDQADSRKSQQARLCQLPRLGEIQIHQFPLASPLYLALQLMQYGPMQERTEDNRACSGTSLAILLGAAPTAAHRVLSPGCCHTGPEDVGLHTVCIELRQIFLPFPKQRKRSVNAAVELDSGSKIGGSLVSCAARWREAFEAESTAGRSHSHS